MSDRPDECQYHNCDDSPDGGLDTHFGERWYCLDHYVLLIEILNNEPDVIEGPTDA